MCCSVLQCVVLFVRWYIFKGTAGNEWLLATRSVCCSVLRCVAQCAVLFVGCYVSKGTVSNELLLASRSVC